ncbi:unnamed protein product [Amoebophrya sp. A120]|nr:unnamed protein product [Amoebophrya sp. A120]|eukprot:GSA120T00005094001.1
MGEQSEPKSALAALMAKKKAQKKGAKATPTEGQDASANVPTTPARKAAAAEEQEASSPAQKTTQSAKASSATAASSSSSTSEWKKAYEIEQDRMAKFGLRINTMQADGACLFRSFAEQMFEDCDRHQEVRDRCVDFLSQNRPEFEPFLAEDEPYEVYLKQMRHPQTWGGDMEIQALSKLYEVNVAVFVPSTYTLSAAAVEQLENEKVARQRETMKKKAQPLWLQEQKVKDSTGGVAAGENVEKEEIILKEEDAAALKTTLRSPSELLQREFGGHAQVVEMYNFSVEAAPVVALSYHPHYHLGRHYNAVRRLRLPSGSQEVVRDGAQDAGAHPTVPGLTEHMKVAHDEKKRQEAAVAAEKAKPVKKTAKDIFG